jgi:disulfide oxidoreductase YuzD
MSDVFIFFDDVQFPKKGGTWSNRVRIASKNNEKWLTAELDRKYSGVRMINESFFNNPSDWRLRSLDILKSCYKDHPFFLETIEFLKPLILNQENNIAEYNIQNVVKTLDYLDIKKTQIYKSSSLKHHGSSNDLLCSLVSSVGGDAYLCGGGADGYQDEAIFNKNQIKLIHQKFSHPMYSQFLFSDFKPGLSIIDLLMNHGKDNSINVIHNGENDPQFLR